MQRETDLYAPVKRHLEAQGYVVKGEIEECDVIAVRGNEDPVIVELKPTFSLQLVLQGIDRQRVTDFVYLAVTIDGGTINRRRDDVLRLCRRLGLGLLVVAGRGRRQTVEAWLDPAPYHPRKQKERRGLLLREFHERAGDPNCGGMPRRKGLMTAYRQRVLRVAEHLARYGKTKASVVRDALSEPEARNILYRDYYGWFRRCGNGVYELSPRGNEEMKRWVDVGETVDGIV